MPTTPAGTDYTITTTTLAGLGRGRVTYPNHVLGESNLDSILYAHGANGGVGSFAGGAGYTDFRNWWLDQGKVVVEGEGGAPDSSGTTFNHWGNDMNRAAYPAYAEWAAGFLDISRWVPIGASMGGLIAKWLLTQSPLAADCAGMIGFASVSTITVGNYDPVSTDTPPNINQRSGRYFSPSMLNAYGVTTYEDLEVAAADHAPENWSPSVWAGKKILELYGTADIAVPWSPRGSQRLREIRAGQPAIDIADEHIGIDHALASGYSAHLSVVTDFLTTVLETTPTPEPQNPTYAEGLARMIRGGELTTVRFG